MSAPPKSRGEPVADRRDLIADLEAGCKPRQDWRIGTEHEKFAFRLADLRPLPYDGADGIRAVLEGLAETFGWEVVAEGGLPIALVKEGCSITLEPGGQVELSGAPLENIHQTCAEVHGHLAEIGEICRRLGVGMLGLGFQPKWGREEIPWMPKGRYRIMQAYMPKVGTMGVDMMLRTCTVQTNLDFESEADMVRKMRVGLALQPVATALFANSPFVDGRPTGYLSWRSHVWTDTDADRCGVLPFVFEDGFGFERWVDYLLDVPMYFVHRGESYIDASGQSFRDFMAGRLPALPGERPFLGDWADHMTTVFPEVRLKRYIEMRGADGGPWNRLCALPALWVGLLYDSDGLQAAWDLVKDWDRATHDRLRADVPRRGLATPLATGTLQDLAREVLTISRAGLARRAIPGTGHDDEGHFLDPLFDIADRGTVPAQDLLASYDTEWGGSVDPLFRAHAY